MAGSPPQAAFLFLRPLYSVISYTENQLYCVNRTERLDGGSNVGYHMKYNSNVNYCMYSDISLSTHVYPYGPL
jgi:hypothetical protein